MSHGEDTGMQSQSESAGNVDWAQLVEQVRAGDAAGMEELYRLFGRGIRFYFYRQLGAQDLEDKIHDTFLIVVQAIRKGDLREPERLMGFVRTIVRRQVAAHIENVVHSRREEMAIEPGTVVRDHSSTPEEDAMRAQRVDIATQTLRSLSARDREILTRFYLYEQTQEQICREMNLTETQFRLLKSRAKARFGDMGRRKMDRSKAPNFLVRAFSSRRH